MKNNVHSINLFVYVVTSKTLINLFYLGLEKGSTCTFVESILRNCGFRTGLFTSPHLIDVRERFRIDG